MTYSIPDTFDSPIGAFINWDTTTQNDANKGFFANQHVNVRNFRTPGVAPRAQVAIEAQPEQVWEANPQITMEQTSAHNDESWTKSGTGLNAITVGAIAARNNWSGLTTTTTGAAISSDLISSMTEVINISAMDHLSIIFPDYNAFDTGTSYIQLTSEPTGSFATAAYLSTQVLFSSNVAAMPHLKLALGGFTATAGASFSLAAITGVKVHLVKAAAPAAGLAFTMTAIRALKSTWTYRQMDFDTRWGALVESVTLDGLAPAGGTGTIPMIRGQGDKNDPIPADVGLNMYFYTGAEATAVATGANYNVLELYFRETKDLAGNNGSWIVARLKWNSTGSIIETVRYDWTAGVLTNTTIRSVTTGITLAPMTKYLFHADIVGTNLNTVIYALDGNLGITSAVFKAANVTNSEYPYRNGRVGLNYTFLDRDCYIEKFEAAVISYATLETQVAPQRHPVDGAQLSARFSADLNLFTDFSADDLFIDQTKTLSGRGSWRSEIALQSNIFLVEDWNNTYLDFAIWVPAGISPRNTPQVSLITQADGSINNLVMPRLQPLQWNRVYFDLTQFLNLLTGVAYSLTISAATQPSTALGSFWLDNIKIGRRRVRWGVRATAGGTYREFRDLVNNPTGAVHFTPEERGTQLELRCDALTADAWTGKFVLEPRHAQLGNPVYDRGYSSR